METFVYDSVFNTDFNIPYSTNFDSWVDDFFNEQSSNHFDIKYDPIELSTNGIMSEPTVPVPVQVTSEINYDGMELPRSSILLESPSLPPVLPPIQQPVLPSLPPIQLSEPASYPEEPLYEPEPIATPVPEPFTFKVPTHDRIIRFSKHTKPLSIVITPPEKPTVSPIRIKETRPIRPVSPSPSIISTGSSNSSNSSDSLSSLNNAVARHVISIDTSSDESSGDEPIESGSESEYEEKKQPIVPVRTPLKKRKQDTQLTASARPLRRKVGITWDWCRIQIKHHPNRKLFDMNWRVNGQWSRFETVKYGPGQSFSNEMIAKNEVKRILRGDK